MRTKLPRAPFECRFELDLDANQPKFFRRRRMPRLRRGAYHKPCEICRLDRMHCYPWHATYPVLPHANNLREPSDHDGSPGDRSANAAFAASAPILDVAFDSISALGVASRSRRWAVSLIKTPAHLRPKAFRPFDAKVTVIAESLGAGSTR